MGSFHRCVIIVLILNIHFSVCTGGFVSVAFAAPAGLSDYSRMDDPLMSPSDYFSWCSLQTPAIAQHEVGKRLPSNPCSDKNTCLKRAERLAISRLHIFSGFHQYPHPPIAHFNFPMGEFRNVHYGFAARDGPLYEVAMQSAHSLVKRE